MGRANGTEDIEQPYAIRSIWEEVVSWAMSTRVTIRKPTGVPYDLSIRDGRFIEPSNDDTKVLDTRSLWALPGLADAHAHLTMTSPADIRGITEDQMLSNIPANSWACVDNGVLLILDKGGGTDVSLVSLDHDADLRPYVEVAGAMIHPRGGYMPGFGAEVEADELVEHVRSVASTKGGWVKIVGDWPRKGRGPVNNYPIEALSEAVAIVHAAGARVAVHTMAHSASDAVAAGVDSIEHGPFLTEEDLKTLADRGGAWVPTVVNMLDVINLLGADSTGGKMFQQGLDRMRENLPLAEQLGVTILAGTDMAVPHGRVSIEALRLKEYGLSDRAATNAVSTSAYDYVGLPSALAPGDAANVVFFKENPHDNVETLQTPEYVIHRGQVIGDRR
jgi:imidazolonepropionase-like amidohydrolase